jgi:hypothetical protein
MLGSELAAITLINDNNYHLDSYSHLRYIVRYDAHIDTIPFHVKQLRQEQRQENKRMGLLNQITLLFTFAIDISLALFNLSEIAFIGET